MRVRILALLGSASALTAPNVTATGSPVVVWAAVDTFHRCKIIDVPDIPARPYAASGEVRLIVGSTSFHRMSGPTLLNQTRECVASWNSTNDADPSHFAGDEFLDSPAPGADGSLYALVHTEYPGNVYKNCSGPAYPHCWTVTIGLAVSRDGGSTWAHAAPPPAHLVAAVPYTYNASQLAYGWGDPSNIFAGRHAGGDGFSYAAVWNRNQVGLQAPGVCFMRTADVTDPRSWRGYGGAGVYNVTFVSPYTLPPGGDASHICSVAVGLPSCPLGGVSWSARLSLYVATMDCSLQAGSQFYVTASPDLLTWAPPRPFYGAHDLPANVSAQVTAMSYPTLVDAAAPDNGDPYYSTLSGDDFLLLWASIGHSPYSDGRHLWATPFRFDGV